MKINAYLNFDGNCDEAMTFYEKALGGKLAFKITNEEAPVDMGMPAGSEKKIMHARLEVGDQTLMASDSPPGRYEAPKGIWVSLGIDKAAEAERVYAALAEGGTVVMPIGETFWAERFGMVTDRFGTPWMINCEKQS